MPEVGGAGSLLVGPTGDTRISMESVRQTGGDQPLIDSDY